MNIESFFSREDIESICNSVKEKKMFNIKRVAKEGKSIFDVTIDGRFIDEKSAKDIWHGNDYLVGLNVNYRGGELGWGGIGRATDDYDMFQNYNTFKEWFDDKMDWYSGYEKDAFGQASFW